MAKLPTPYDIEKLIAKYERDEKILTNKVLRFSNLAESSDASFAEESIFSAMAEFYDHHAETLLELLNLLNTLKSRIEKLNTKDKKCKTLI